MVSSARPAYEARLVRLVHGDENPDGPGFQEEELAAPFDGEHAGRVQMLEPGSYVRAPALEVGPSFTIEAWVCPTAPAAGEQTILSTGGVSLVLDEGGGVALRVGGSSVRTGVPLRAWEWHLATAVVADGRARVSQRPLRAMLLDEGRA